MVGLDSLDTHSLFFVYRERRCGLQHCIKRLVNVALIQWLLVPDLYSVFLSARRAWSSHPTTRALITVSLMVA